MKTPSSRARAAVTLSLALPALACSSSSTPASTADASATALTAQGCHPERPATAYTTGASASTLATAPSGVAPFPCLSLTGFGTSEASVGFASDGTVFFAPAESDAGVGVARSKDDGVT